MAYLHSTLCFLLIAAMTILASVNGQGLRSPNRRKLTFSFFNMNKFDIVFIQETRFTSEMEHQIQRELDGDAFFIHGTNSARGVAIMFSSRREYKVIQTRRDKEGRILNILLNMDEHSMNIVKVYVPSSDTERRTFFSDLEQSLSRDYANIIGGDFNCTLDTRQDKFGGYREARQSASSFLRAINGRYDLWMFGGTAINTKVTIPGVDETRRVTHS